MKRLIRVAVAAIALVGLALQPVAAAYPEYPIRVIVPFAAGGSIDVLCRAIQRALAKELGKPVIIENRPGGGATIGMNVVARAAPDGYTIGAANLSFAANPPFLRGSIPYESEKAFAPVMLVARLPLVLTVNPSVPAHTVTELVALSKRQPGSLNYGSTGIASSGHLGGALFESLSGTKMVHVPYGSTNVVASVAAGNVQVLIGPVPSSLPFIRSGKLIPLGVTTRQRMSALPDVPTIAESGLPAFEMFDWIGFVAPAGTPADVVQLLNAALARSLRDPAVKSAFETVGAETAGGSPAEFQSFLTSEFVKWSKLADEVRQRDPAAAK